MSVEARDFLKELDDQATLDLLSELASKAGPQKLILPPHPTGRILVGIREGTPEDLKLAIGELELALGLARPKPPKLRTDSKAANLTSISVLLTQAEQDSILGRSLPRGALAAPVEDLQAIPEDATPVVVHCDPWVLNEMRALSSGDPDLLKMLYRATFLRYAPTRNGPGLCSPTVRFRMSETLAMIAFDQANREGLAWEDFWLPLAIEAQPSPYDANDPRIGASFRALTTAERCLFRDKLEMVARLEGAIYKWCETKYPCRFPVHAALSAVKDPLFRARHRKA